MSGWWFPIFFYFHPYLGKITILRLKPSTMCFFGCRWTVSFLDCFLKGYWVSFDPVKRMMNVLFASFFTWSLQVWKGSQVCTDICLTFLAHKFLGQKSGWKSSDRGAKVAIWGPCQKWKGNKQAVLAYVTFVVNVIKDPYVHVFALYRYLYTHIYIYIWIHMYYINTYVSDHIYIW